MKYSSSISMDCILFTDFLNTYFSKFIDFEYFIVLNKVYKTQKSQINVIVHCTNTCYSRDMTFFILVLASRVPYRIREIITRWR